MGAAGEAAALLTTRDASSREGQNPGHSKHQGNQPGTHPQDVCYCLACADTHTRLLSCYLAYTTKQRRRRTNVVTFDTNAMACSTFWAFVLSCCL